jgi:hypothetical protein
MALPPPAGNRPLAGAARPTTMSDQPDCRRAKREGRHLAARFLPPRFFSLYLE